MTLAAAPSQPTNRFALSHGRIVLPDVIALGKAVVIEGERIVGIADAGALSSDTMPIDVTGRYITPGLIDIHTHGALEHTFNEPTEEAFDAITRENARRGVTALLATLAPAPIPDLVRCLEFCQAWMREKHGGSQVLGMHLESPYVSPAQKGALDPRNLHAPGDGTPDVLLAHHDVIKIFVVAPELPGALKLIHRLSDLNIVPAAGHSMAKEEDVRAAIREGLRHGFHRLLAEGVGPHGHAGAAYGADCAGEGAIHAEEGPPERGRVQAAGDEVPGRRLTTEPTMTIDLQEYGFLFPKGGLAAFRWCSRSPARISCTRPTLAAWSWAATPERRCGRLPIAESQVNRVMGALSPRWDQPLPGGLPERHSCDDQNDSLQVEHYHGQECLRNVSGLRLPLVVASPKAMPRLGLAELGLFRVALVQPLLVVRGCLQPQLSPFVGVFAFRPIGLLGRLNPRPSATETGTGCCGPAWGRSYPHPGTTALRTCCGRTTPRTVR